MESEAFIIAMESAPPRKWVIGLRFLALLRRSPYQPPVSVATAKRLLLQLVTSRTVTSFGTPLEFSYIIPANAHLWPFHQHIQCYGTRISTDIVPLRAEPTPAE